MVQRLRERQSLETAQHGVTTHLISEILALNYCPVTIDIKWNPLT